MDNLSVKDRSTNMSKISSMDTRAELRVRSFLFKKGLRFRKNVATLPGKPDMVFNRRNVVLFIHGCFWHRHKNCNRTTHPKTNRAYWKRKFRTNMERDKRNSLALRRLGYKVLLIWECQTASVSKLESIFSKIVSMELK